MNMRKNDVIEMLEEKLRNALAENAELNQRVTILEDENAALRKLAMHHPISGLYSINYVNDEIERIRSAKERECHGGKKKVEYVCVTFIDLDNLKVIKAICPDIPPTPQPFSLEGTPVGLTGIFYN